MVNSGVHLAQRQWALRAFPDGEDVVNNLNQRETKMVAFRAAMVALILATMVATFLALAILALKGLDSSPQTDSPAGISSGSGTFTE